MTALSVEAMALSPRCTGDLTQVEEGTMVTEQRDCIPELAALRFPCTDLHDAIQLRGFLGVWMLLSHEGGTSPSVGGDAMQKSLSKLQTRRCNTREGKATGKCSKGSGLARSLADQGHIADYSQTSVNITMRSTSTLSKQDHSLWDLEDNRS